MSGSVVNVMAMLTGNASSLVGAMGTGSEATKGFRDTYAKTATDVMASSREIQASLQKEADAAVAAAAAASGAADKKAQAAALAAAQATVAADKEATAHAKAAAAAQAASDATVRAAATGAEADQAAAVTQAEAAQKAANAADLAAQQKITAAGRAAEAQKASTAAIAASLQAEKDAQEKTAAAADIAAAQKKAAGEASMATMTKVAAGTAVAVGIVAIGALDMAAKYEKSTELLVTAGGEAQGNLQSIRDGILAISQTTGIGAEQLSQGMYTVEKATFRGAAGLNVLHAAAEGAAAENVDMGTMTNALTSIMMSYHLTSDKAVATTNELVAGAGAAKTTMQDYAASLASVLPVASAAGISFAEVGGAIATLTQHGTSADESTQELANTIRSLQAPNNVAVSEMQQLGLSATDVAQNLGKRGLTGTIELITDAIQNHLGPAGTVIVNAMKESATGTADLHTMMAKMPDSLRTTAQGFLDGTVSMKDFQKSFKDMGAQGDAQGKQFLALANTVNGYNDQIKQGGPAAQTAAAALKEIMGGATGMNTALMLGGENMSVFKEKTQEMTDAANRNGKDISTNAATQATLAQTTARVKATFEELAIQLGTVLMPVLKNILDGFMSMVTWLQNNKGPAEALGLAIAAVAAGLLAGVIAAKAWAAGQVIVAAATAILTGNFEALTAVMAINPFVLAAVALAALVAGIIWAYNNIGWFKDGVDAAWKWIQNAFRTSIDWIVNTGIPWLIGAWNTTVKIFQQSVGMFVDFFNNTVGMFKDFFTNTVGMFTDWSNHTRGMFRDWGTNTAGMFIDFFKNTVGMFKDFGTNTYGMITDFVKNTLGMFSDWGARLLKGFIGWWHDPIGETQKFVSSILTIIGQWALNTEGMFGDFFKNVWNGFFNWGVSVIVAFYGWRDQVYKTIGEWAQRTAGMFADFGKHTIGMFVDFFNNTLGMFVDFFTKNAPNAVGTWAKNTHGMIDDFQKNTAGMFTDFFKNTLGMFSDFFGKKAPGAVGDWAKNTHGMIDDWQKNTAGMFTDFFKNTVGMFIDFVNHTIGMVKDWIKNTAGMFIDWHNQLTGTTRRFVDDVIGFFVTLWHNIQTAWNNIMDAGHSAMNWIGTNVFDPLKRAVGWVGDAFSNVASTIKTVWAAIQDAAQQPARFVVNTVYNAGIRPAWNAIASAVGLGGLSLPAETMANGGVAGFAGGGVGGINPGYAPRVDSIPAMTSPGEAWMVPEWTRMVGADNVHRMNAMARGGNAAGIGSILGLKGFADGGIAGILGGIGNLAQGVIGNIGSFISNPLGGVKDLLNGAISGLMGMIGGGNFGKMMGAVPGMFINGFADLVSGKENAIQAAARVSSGPGPVTTNGGAGGAASWTGTVMQALNMLGQPIFLLGSTLRRMNQESGGNPSAINNWDSNAAAGIPSKGLMQVIDPTFASYAMPGYNTNIYDPLSNILASMRYAISRYGSLANAYDRPGGYAMGGIAPTLFDQGGYLPVGTSMVQNNTGQPERVLAPGQGLMDGQVIEIVIPELGGRLSGYVKGEIAGNSAAVNRSLRNSPGVPKGGF